MRVFTTSAIELARPAVADGVQLHPGRAARQEDRDGAPFLLAADGQFVASVNRFLAELPSDGAPSPATAVSYARDLACWGSFLERRGVHLLRAGPDDLAAFYGERRTPDDGHGVAAKTWDRNVSTLDRFYAWAHHAELIDRLPFKYDRRRDRLGNTRLVNRARDRYVRSGDVRYLSPRAYHLFREVGLRGLTVDGREDPTFRGHLGCAERNALLADLLVGCGLRINECVSLLAAELPQPDATYLQGGAKSVPLRVLDVISKGQRGRTVPMPRRWLRDARQYLTAERATAVSVAAHRRSYDAIKPLVAVSAAECQGLREQRGDGGAGALLRYDRLSPWARRHAYLVDDDGRPREPCALFLTEAGTPLDVDAVESSFRRATQRCGRLGVDLGVATVTPHTLRHTFAVNMLSHLVKAAFGVIELDRGSPMSAYARRLTDPLRRLQLMLGHASRTSTEIYMDSVDLALAAVDEACGGWDEELARW